MYFIPKNIKVKKEIFKGFGMLEILAMAVSCAIAYLLSMIIMHYQKDSDFFSFLPISTFILPLSTFILLVPLPMGGNSLNVFIKFYKYIKNQKQYKKYN